MEQTISKFPNPFGSVAPHKLFAWGLSATVGYGFAVWGVRIYQNQTVELGGQLLVVLMQAFVLPALLYGADRLRRRLPQSVVADRAGISLNTLSKIENGDCGVSIGNIASVLNALGLSPLLSGLAAAQEDSAGLMLEERNLPQRVRSKKKSAGL